MAHHSVLRGPIGSYRALTLHHAQLILNNAFTSDQIADIDRLPIGSDGTSRGITWTLVPNSTMPAALAWRRT
jgi:hypothetical protein